MHKKRLFHHFFSTDTVDLEILQLDWAKKFWQISQEPEVSQVCSKQCKRSLYTKLIPIN